MSRGTSASSPAWACALRGRPCSLTPSLVPLRRGHVPWCWAPWPGDGSRYPHHGAGPSGRRRGAAPSARGRWRFPLLGRAVVPTMSYLQQETATTRVVACLCDGGASTMRVTEVLRRKGSSVVTIAPDRSVRQVLGLLAEHRIGALVVSEDG